MDDRYRGMPETDWLMMICDVLMMGSSIERVGDDILVCDELGEETVFNDFKFAREEKHDSTETMRELMNEELDVSKEMELLKKAYKKQ